MTPRDRRNFCPVSGKECFDRRARAERVVYNSKSANTQRNQAASICASTAASTTSRTTPTRTTKTARHSTAANKN